MSSGTFWALRALWGLGADGSIGPVCANKLIGSIAASKQDSINIILTFFIVASSLIFTQLIL